MIREDYRTVVLHRQPTRHRDFFFFQADCVLRKNFFCVVTNVLAWLHPRKDAPFFRALVAHGHTRVC